jgi:hypothetical protein
MSKPISTRRILAFAAIGVLCAALAVQIEGCTAVGFLVGAAADDRNGIGGPGLLMDVKPGRRVTLQLWDGRELEGRFAGWSRDSVDSLSATDIISPRGARVRLTTVQGEILVPTESIAKVMMTVNGGKIGGLLAGLALDAMVISAVRSTEVHPTGCDAPPFTQPW